MSKKYWILKFYRGENCIGLFYSDEVMAEEAFDEVASGMGNPHLMHGRDIDPTGEGSGKLTLGPLGEFDLIELVELISRDELVIDSASAGEEDE